mgnify:CR=1 FL=1
MADRRAGGVYAGPHRLHCVHLFQFHGSGGGLQRFQRPGAAAAAGGAAPSGPPGPCPAPYHAHRAQDGPLLRVYAGGLSAHALHAGVHPAVCPAHQRAHAGRCAHGHGRRDDPDLFPGPQQSGHRRLAGLGRCAGRHPDRTGLYGPVPDAVPSL